MLRRKLKHSTVLPLRSSCVATRNRDTVQDQAFTIPSGLAIHHTMFIIYINKLIRVEIHILSSRQSPITLSYGCCNNLMKKENALAIMKDL